MYLHKDSNDVISRCSLDASILHNFDKFKEDFFIQTLAKLEERKKIENERVQKIQTFNDLELKEYKRLQAKFGKINF